MEKKSALKAAVAGVALAGSLAVAAPAASATTCAKDQVVIGGQCGTVTSTLPDETRGSRITTGIRQDMTTGVTFRDDNGNRTSSGMAVKDQFNFLGPKKMGRNGDGMLVKVKQITKGQGGWGDLYIGWIPVKYTMAPQLFS